MEIWFIIHSLGLLGCLQQQRRICWNIQYSWRMWGFSSFTNISKSEYEMQSLKEEYNYEALSLPTPACWATCWCWRVLVRCITAVNSGRCALSVQISWLVISEAGNNTKYIRGLFTPKLSLYIHFIVVCCGIMTVECSLELLNFNIDHAQYQ